MDLDLHSTISLYKLFSWQRKNIKFTLDVLRTSVAHRGNCSKNYNVKIIVQVHAKKLSGNQSLMDGG